TISDLNTPFNHPDDTGDYLEVTDPAHPLYGRHFEIASAARNPDGHVFVRYRDGIVLRLPRAATSLLTLGRAGPCDRLCRSAVQELLALVKEYESCPKVRRSPRAMSGPRSRAEDRQEVIQELNRIFEEMLD